MQDHNSERQLPHSPMCFHNGDKLYIGWKITGDPAPLPQIASDDERVTVRVHPTEMLLPDECERCNGRGVVPRYGIVVDCPACVDEEQSTQRTGANTLNGTPTPPPDDTQPIDDPCSDHKQPGWYIDDDGQRRLLVPPHRSVDAGRYCTTCGGWLPADEWADCD